MAFINVDYRRLVPVKSLRGVLEALIRGASPTTLVAIVPVRAPFPFYFRHRRREYIISICTWTSSTIAIVRLPLARASSLALPEVLISLLFGTLSQARDVVRLRYCPFLMLCLQAIVHRKVVQLGEVFVDTQDLLMLNCLLQFCLCSVPLFLLLDKLLNLGGVKARWRGALVINFADFNDALDLGLDVAVCQILLLEQQLRVLPPQRSVVQSRLGRVGA